MSDYLWDKSGAPDPEVERLESLLGSRRYEREPLRLPPEAAVDAARRSYAFGSYAFGSYTRGPAAAAAIVAGFVLAVIGGAWLNELRENVTTGNAVTTATTSRMTMRSGEVPAASSRSGGGVSHADIKPEVDDPIEDTRSGSPRHGLRAASGATKDGSKKDRSKVSGERAIREPAEHVEIVRATTRTVQERGASRSNRIDDAGTADHKRQADEQRNAKEQLMFALRLTSTKLSVARAKTQAAPASEADAGAR